MSGDASIRCVISIAPVRSSTMPLPLGLLFSELAQPAEIARPHLSQHHLERAERPPIGFVVAMGALAPLGDQAGILEHSQVLGNRRPAHVANRRGDFTGGALRTPDQPQDLASPRTGDRLHGGCERMIASSALHSGLHLFKLLLN